MSQDHLRRTIRGALIALCLLGGMSTAAFAQVRIGVGVGIALPGARIGINIPAYPDLVPVPGYPVYYAPQLDVNLFFYDGLYWLFANDEWYSSTWYNGPWYLVSPYEVPDFILRIPVGFYRRPPPFFRFWSRQEPPRWGEHWGQQWQRRRPGWDRWNRGALPPRAPLPRYQRDYPHDRYPGAREQRSLENRFYPFPEHRQPNLQRREPPRPQPRYQEPPQRYQQQQRQRYQQQQQQQQQRHAPPQRVQQPQQRRNQEQQQRRDREHERRPGEHPPG